MKKSRGTHWISVGRNVAPETWAENVKSVPGRYRAAVARIIWWDWFAARLVGERWDHLDQYLRYPIEGETWNDYDLKRGLIKVGYPQAEAIRRIRSTK